MKRRHHTPEQVIRKLAESIIVTVALGANGGEDLGPCQSFGVANG